MFSDVYVKFIFGLNLKQTSDAIYLAVLYFWNSTQSKRQISYGIKNFILPLKSQVSNFNYSALFGFLIRNSKPISV